jgi:hypothetical protein
MMRLNQNNASRKYTGTRLDRQGTEKWFLGMDNNTDNFNIRRAGSFNDLTIDTNGNIGIGSSTPSAKLAVGGNAVIAGTLSVAGEIQIASTSLACATSTAGAMRYNSSFKVMEYCNGSIWLVVRADAVECTDSDPIGTICGGGTKAGNNLVVMPSDCDGTTNNPSCTLLTDGSQVGKTYSAAAGIDEPADSTSDGLANTLALLGNPATDNGSTTDALPPTNNAALYCFNLMLYNKTNWYLPAKDELNVLYTLKASNPTAGGFNASSSYWSSTEYNTSIPWSQLFSNGTQGLNPKTNTYYVRCVRRYR